MLARKRVKNVYGFSVSAGIYKRNTQSYIDPVKLEEQRLKVQEIRKELPPFEYGLYEDEENEPGIEKVKKDTQVLADNAQYEGEWNVDTDMRHGQGYQIWSDGSIYEGYWKHDKANGRGRLIHADGDIYDGYWKDDKAHGYGQYTHTDGAQYSGHW